MDHIYDLIHKNDISAIKTSIDKSMPMYELIKYAISNSTLDMVIELVDLFELDSNQMALCVWYAMHQKKDDIVLELVKLGANVTKRDYESGIEYILFHYKNNEYMIKSLLYARPGEWRDTCLLFGFDNKLLNIDRNMRKAVLT